MTASTRSNSVEATPARVPAASAAPLLFGPTGRTVERLCRPLTAEELQIIRGSAPEDDTPPAA